MAEATLTARVFLLEPTTQRIGDALKRGPLQYVFPPDSARSSIWDTQTLSDEIEARLKAEQYNPQIDFVIITGNIVPLATMIAAIANEYGEFQALLFHAADHCYVERILG